MRCRRGSAPGGTTGRPGWFGNHEDNDKYSDNDNDDIDNHDEHVDDDKYNIIDNDNDHVDDDNYHNVGGGGVGGDLSDKSDGDTNDRRNPSAMTIVIKSNFETPNIAIQFDKV